jgi:hypothetical protein
MQSGVYNNLMNEAWYNTRMFQTYGDCKYKVRAKRAESAARKIDAYLSRKN